MDAQRVDMFIMSNAKYFESYQLNAIRDRLIAMDDSKWVMISTLQLKDPTTSLIVSILVGTLGVDRFIIGDTGLGIGKLRSEEHTSELQSLMRISYAVFCLKKKK